MIDDTGIEAYGHIKTKLNEKEHFSLSKIDRDGNKVLVGRMPYVYSRNPSKIFKKHYEHAYCVKIEVCKK